MKRVLAILAVCAAVTLIWYVTPLRDVARPDALMDFARGLRGRPEAALVVPFAYLALSMVLFPVVALRVATVLVFGPVLGPIYALTGSVLAGAAGWLIGKKVGAEAFEQRDGDRLARLRDLLRRRGIMSVVIARQVPLGPFTMVNAMFGAIGVRFRDFILGTAIGMVPGLVLMAFFGGSLERLLTRLF